MLVLPQAVQLSIHFFVKENQQCCTSSRDLNKDTLLTDRKRKKAQHPTGFEPTTSKVLLPRPALQPLPLLSFDDLSQDKARHSKLNNNYHLTSWSCKFFRPKSTRIRDYLGNRDTAIGADMGLNLVSKLVQSSLVTKRLLLVTRC